MREGQTGGRGYQEARGNFGQGAGGYVHYVDCGDGFTVVFIDKNIKLYTL